MTTSRAEARSDSSVATEPVATPSANSSGATVADALLRLQHTAGNRAVAALVQRAVAAPADPVVQLRQLLKDDNEDAAIAAMGALSPEDAKRVLDLPDLRHLAVKSFNDREMARAITSLKGGSLLQKLRWFAAEDVDSLGLIWPLLVDKNVPANEKTALYPENDIRSYFISVCGDDQMAAVVDALGGELVQKLHWMLLEGTSWDAVVAKLNKHRDAKERARLYQYDFMRELFVKLLDDEEMAILVHALGGTLDQKLSWMAAEGTNGGLVFAEVRAASDADIATVTAQTRAALKREIGAEDFRRVEQMLDESVLTWQQISYEQSEKHYELSDASNPAGGWSLKEFEWKSKYEILYARNALRIRVRICLTGETATAAHKKIWLDGISNRYNGKFHIENDHRLALVFEPVFTEVKPHHTVKLHKPPIVREDSSNWYAGPTANSDPTKPPDTTTGDTAAHEFGHLVGLIDEYRLTAAEFKRLTGRTGTVADQDAQIGYTDPGLMSAGQADVQERHLTQFVSWLNKNRRKGEKLYKVVPGP